MWIKEDSKKRPKMTKHKQSTQTRTSTKRSIREAREAPGTATTTASRGSGGIAVLSETQGRASPCPEFAFFRYDF